MPGTPAPPKRQRLDLPFVKRRKDTVTVIYDHRVGIFAVVGMLLVVAILFVGSKIAIRTPTSDNAVTVDLRTVEELRREAERLQREVDMRREMYDANGYIRNAISNEGAEQSEEHNRNMADIRSKLDDANSRMNSTRDAYDEGMREIEAMRADRGDREGSNVNRDTRAKGTVQVSFSLVDPLRYSVDLPNPGYTCERGGRVVVAITVNRGGDVVAATVDRAASDSDNCMHEAALGVALRSRFNVDRSAPERQTGTITYLFIPQ